MIGPFRSFDHRQFKFIIDEDDAATIDSLQKIFSEYNCIADIYSTGEALLEALPKKDYDMVWLRDNIALHGMGGYEVAKIIRSRKDPLARIPIYLFTQDDYYHCSKQAQALEINGYIPKPFTPEICRELVQYLREKL